MHPMSTSPASKSDFQRRLAYFLIGLAIGLVMLGLFQRARRAEMARAEIERASLSAAAAAKTEQAGAVQAAPRGAP